MPVNGQARQIKGFGKGLYSTRGGNLSGLKLDGVCHSVCVCVSVCVVVAASGVVHYLEVHGGIKALICERAGVI